MDDDVADTTDEREAEGIREELGRIQAALADLPTDAWGERAELRDRQRTLRSRARSLADADDLPALRAREQALLVAIERVRHQGVGVASIGGGGGPGGGGIDPYEAMELTRRIRDGLGMPELERELARVRARIERVAATDA